MQRDELRQLLLNLMADSLTSTQVDRGHSSAFATRLPVCGDNFEFEVRSWGRSSSMSYVYLCSSCDWTLQGRKSGLTGSMPPERLSPAPHASKYQYPLVDCVLCCEGDDMAGDNLGVLAVHDQLWAQSHCAGS